MEYLLIGIATAFNVLVIQWKLERKRYADGIFDALLLILLSGVMGGSLGGLIIGSSIALMVLSYLIVPVIIVLVIGSITYFIFRVKGKLKP